MAAPIIGSPLTLDVITGVNFQYKIKARNMPDTYDATPLPFKTEVDTDTGIISGRIKTAAVYSVTISATNDDGTGTAVLVITATEGTQGGDNGQVTVYQAKYWNDLDSSERIDYADLDSAGQPILDFDQGAIGVDQLKANTYENKVTAIGGPGRRLQFVFPTDLLFFLDAPFSQVIGTMDAIGITAGDPVICDNFIGPDDSPNGEDGTPLPVYIYAGCEADDSVTFYGFTLGGPFTILKGSRIDARAFTFL